MATHTRVPDDIEDRLEALDPATTHAQDARDLRAIREVVEAVKAGQGQLLAAVTAARKNGKNWGQIGIALGVSRQAARERFMTRVEGRAEPT